MMDDARLAEIEERFTLWAEYGDTTAFEPEHAGDLIAELRYMRALHHRETALLRRARAELVRISDSYRELQITARHWADATRGTTL